MADSKRQLKIKTDSVTRLGKELSYYVKEQEGLERKLSALRQSQADPYDIKKTEEFVDETVSVVQDTHSRLVKSYADLEGYVKQNHGQDGLAGSEELTKAEAALESAASLIRS
ncbi:Tubulin-specific chaperone A [Plasmodiophora brassicae]|uniref:Tubulin-specific chaperone A n=1 Tax=Plasmodiophora brassicae TaxID=37360 RepID=A0A0G4IMP9_PLABS|nr:hypothetical protein PBRA_005095 [Plasmodiophora brassicae]SPQ99364.1 unnamed protein product [Plasmodiophora brassicae]